MIGLQVLVDGYGSVGNIWRVPEMGSSDDIGCRMKVKEEELELELKGKDGWKMRHREASVLRYKEKRQNRLFSKRIRYEVRKLNAEKRPRMKVTLILYNWYEFLRFHFQLLNLMQCFKCLKL